MGTTKIENIATTVDPKNEAQAKTAILNFLTQLNIQKIVYVDDRCSINELKEAYVGKLKAHYKTKPAELDFVDWELAEQVFESRIVSLWDSKNDEERRDFYLKIFHYLYYLHYLQILKKLMS